MLECPEGWEWVFSSRIDPVLPPPPGLQAFCRYVGEDEDPRPRHRTIENPFVKYDLFESIERDCRIVGPAAPTIFPPQAYANALRGRFLREARGGAPQNPPGPSDDVRLVIVDSVQDDESPHDRQCPPTTREGDLECSRHGEVLVQLARDLLCTQSDCGAEITTRRTLPWTHEIRSADAMPKPVKLAPVDSPGPAQGGSSGAVVDLALAIWREVETWWQEPDKPRLILNLSVGWEPIHASAAGVLGQTVRAAIEDAVCRGALVIAAAGNRVSGPPDLERPLLPAAFEQAPAPTPIECLELLGPSGQAAVPSGASYQPLVYAVGSVQADGLPLSNSRPNATPRLVAFGDHAPVLNPGPPQNLKVLTGTSVSTVVVSAAAAERWRRDPNLAPFDLMERLWDRGEPLRQRVDFCLNPETNCPPNETARRIYVFPPGPSTAPTAWPNAKPQLSQSLVSNLMQPVIFPVEIDLPDCDPRPLKSTSSPAPGAELCPQRFFDVRSQPWLGPQPGANHNPACSFNQGSPGTLALEFEPCYRVEGKPARIDDFTLIVANRAYRLPIEEFQLGDPSQPCPLQNDPRRMQVVLTDFYLDNPPYPMYLAVTINGAHATISPILQVFGEQE